MKKHSISILLLFFGIVSFNSCLKQEPEVTDTTIFYGHQRIPDINVFMPQRLLMAFGDTNLHYGDNPPRMEGRYVSHQREVDTFSVVDSSQWQPPMPTPASDIFFDLTEQHIGIAQLNFTYTTDTEHHGTTANTLDMMKDKMEAFAADTIAPAYFKEGHHTLDDFGTIYIMGNTPYFTAYYYEIRDTRELPLFAVILSGKMVSEQVILTDTLGLPTDTIVQHAIVEGKFGFETMRYCGPFPTDLPRYPYPGDLVVYDCDTLRLTPTVER